MSRLYQKNIEYIKKLNISIYRRLEKLKVFNVVSCQAKNGKINLKKKLNEDYIYIHSNYDPINQAKAISDYAIQSNPDIIFLFGLGLGYELKEMLKKAPNTRYFIIEPDKELFKHALEFIDIQYLFNDNNIFFIQDDNKENIAVFFNSLLQHDKSVNIKFITLPSYLIMYRELILDMNKYIKEIINKVRINLRTTNLSSRAWCQSFIANLKYMDTTCPVEKLKNTLKGIPAIVVAAGPSLNDNIDTLKKINRRAIIASAGTGIQILEKHGIKADIAGAVDVWRTEEELFESLQINKDTTLFYSTHVAYKVPDMMKKRRFLLNTGIMDKYLYQNFKWQAFNMFSGPSVANTVVYNLSELGCNPIFILGQDLCISSEKWYAEGAKNNVNLTKRYLEAGQYIRTTNKIGDEVYTLNAFLAMKSSLEECIVGHNKIKFYNGTKNGLQIDGAENIDFNQYFEENILKSDTRYDIDQLVGPVYDEHLSTYASETISQFIKSLKNQNDTLTKILKEALEFIEENDDETAIGNYVKSIERELNQISFYKEVLKYMGAEIEYIYLKLPLSEKYRQFYSYLLDKCLIMDNAFKYELLL